MCPSGEKEKFHVSVSTYKVLPRDAVSTICKVRVLYPTAYVQMLL